MGGARRAAPTRACTDYKLTSVARQPLRASAPRSCVVHPALRVTGTLNSNVVRGRGRGSGAGWGGRGQGLLRCEYAVQQCAVLASRDGVCAYAAEASEPG